MRTCGFLLRKPGKRARIHPMKGRTGMMNRPENEQPAMKPTGGVGLEHVQAEKESSCGLVPFASLHTVWHVTDRNHRATDPHGRQRGGRRSNPPAYPIGRIIVRPLPQCIPLQIEGPE